MIDHARARDPVRARDRIAGGKPIGHRAKSVMLLGLAGWVAIAGMDRTAMAQTPTVDIIDASTRWEFTVIENAVVDSPIIRVGDILRPIRRDFAAWSRLSGATVGLMPLDGSPAKISRDRLANLIAAGQATPARIKLHGSALIQVQRVASTFGTNGPESHPPRPDPRQSPTVHSVGYRDAVKRPSAAKPETANSSPVDADVAARLDQWIRLGIRNGYRDLADAFEFSIELRADEIGSLGQLQGIREIEFIDVPPVWSVGLTQSPEPVVTRIRVHGRAGTEMCQGIATVHWVPQRPVVMATASMRRGQRVGPEDVQHQPAPIGQVDEAGDWVLIPDDIIGMEVTGQIRLGTPLRTGDFTAPRLVRRGDLLEVRVSGGGVRVTTTAKSFGEGAAGDLVEIETIQPRRRLLARVVDSSIVEIVTQPHRSR